MSRFLCVVLAGGLGAGSRYLVNLWAESRWGDTFPVATLAVNLVGCLLLGALMQLAISIPTFSPTVRVALGTGFLGGLTTYSSFNHETTRFLQNGQVARAAGYFGLTVAGAFLFGLAGMWLARRCV
jgi:CrcB protein